MLEPTKKQTTGEFADLCFRVPAVHADRIRAVADNILALLGSEDQGMPAKEGQGGEDRLYRIDEVFPDFHHGDTLKGARLMHELTQAQLAVMIGVKGQLYFGNGEEQAPHRQGDGPATGQGPEHFVPGLFIASVPGDHRKYEPAVLAGP